MKLTQIGALIGMMLSVLVIVVPVLREELSTLCKSLETVKETEGKGAARRLWRNIRARGKLKWAVFSVLLALWSGVTGCVSATEQQKQMDKDSLSLSRQEIILTNQSLTLTNLAVLSVTNDSRVRLLFDEFLALNDIMATGGLYSVEGRLHFLQFSNGIVQLSAKGGFSLEEHKARRKREHAEAKILGERFAQERWDRQRQRFEPLFDALNLAVKKVEGTNGTSFTSYRKLPLHPPLGPSSLIWSNQTWRIEVGFQNDMVYIYRSCGEKRLTPTSLHVPMDDRPKEASEYVEYWVLVLGDLMIDCGM